MDKPVKPLPELLKEQAERRQAKKAKARHKTIRQASRRTQKVQSQPLTTQDDWRRRMPKTAIEAQLDRIRKVILKIKNLRVDLESVERRLDETEKNIKDILKQFNNYVNGGSDNI